MSISLPMSVDYTREEQASGAIVYVFKHIVFGVLGSLYLIPDFNGSRLVWEPVERNGIEILCSTPSFIAGIMEEAQNIIATLQS